MVNILFADRPQTWEEYERPLTTAFQARDLDVTLATDLPPETVDYIIYAPSSPVQDFTPYTRLKAVLNLWAGVEDIIGNDTLQVPLTRMVDSGLTDGMVQWVAAHVLRHHMDLDTHITQQDGVWRFTRSIQPLARHRTVGILGLGELGGACGQSLAAMGFNVLGWSRSAKSIPGVTALQGPDGLDDLLAQAEILVLLTPLTSRTENILNADRLAKLPRGACIINPGRGGLIDDAALLSALDSGQISHATLDTFRVEPLPPEHPYWGHASVTVTPHIASQTRPDTASEAIATNVARAEAGEPLLHVVDRADR